MRRFLITVVAMAGLALPPTVMAAGPTSPGPLTPGPMTSAPNTSRPPPPAGTFKQDAKALDQAIAKHDCHLGLPAARRFVANPRFEPLDDHVKLTVWRVAAACAEEIDLKEEAFGAARHATQFPDANDWLWIYRIAAGADLDHADDVADATERLAVVRPATLNAVPIRAFLEFQLQQEHKRPDALRRVLAALENADYKPKAVLDSADWL